MNIRRAAIYVVAFALALPLVGRLPPIRTTLLTAALVPEIMRAGPRPLSLMPEPSVRRLTYGTPADRIDVYLPYGSDGPARATLPAVVLALGVHPQPVDHPDIVGLASAISRLGVVVGVPDSSALRELVVGPAEPAHLADAVLLVAGLAEVDPTRVGLAGFSAGASIALLAAADPRIAGSVRYVSAFGGYATAERLLIDVATRTSLSDGQLITWNPDPGIRRDILKLALATLGDHRLRDELRALLGPVAAAESPPTGPDPAIANRFVGDGRQLYLLFTARDRDAAQAAIDGLSADLRNHLAGISPLSAADGIRAPVFLLHGVTDTAIPVTHARLLADGIGAEVTRLTLFGRFGHEQPGQSGLGPDDVADVWELSLYLRDIVAAATE